MEIAKLEEFNHWWIRGKVDPELALPFKRDIYEEIEKSIAKKFILALVGLRRIGKTVLIYQFIQKLISEGVPKENIIFFSFDESAAQLGDILDSYKEFQKKDFRDDKVYIFLDEIQKCNNWENEIKKYYDLYPKIKIIISGSESLFIKKKTKETLAGRIIEFALTPFSFREYLRFHGIKELDLKYETKIAPLFVKYAKMGGFPETFSFDVEVFDKPRTSVRGTLRASKNLGQTSAFKPRYTKRFFDNDKEFKEYIRALVVDKIVYKDIPKSFKIESPEFLGVLLELIATNPGINLDYMSLSKQFEKDRRVIKDYISYLKESFLVCILGNYRKGSITTLRKMKKAYPTDNALSYMYKLGIDDSFFGKMIECLVVNKLKAKSFWKDGNEVDIVVENFPIEVKYQEQIGSGDFIALKSFMRKFNVKEGVMITKKDERQITIEEGKIKLIPAWKWFLG